MNVKKQEKSNFADILGKHFTHNEMSQLFTQEEKIYIFCEDDIIKAM